MDDERQGDPELRRRQDRRVSALLRHDRPGRHGHPDPVREDRDVHVRPRIPLDRELPFEHHLHRRRPGRAALSRLPDRAARGAMRLPRGLLPAPQRRAAHERAEAEVRPHGDRPHDDPRAAQPPVFGLSPRLAPDGGDGRRRRRAVGVLSRLARHQRSRPARDRRVPADREDADDRGDGVQVLGRAAVHVPAERPVLYRQLHAHDVRRAGRGVPGEPGAGAGARPDLHPARRSRAERVDLDGAARRVLGRQSVRVHLLRHRLPLGSGARRGERGGARHARGDPRRLARQRVHQEGEGQELRVSA